MLHQKLKILILLAVAFLSLPIFVLAQTNPTIEVCAGTCYPDVVAGSSILVNNDDGSIPGDLTYKRGSTLRIHSNVSDPGGINYVKAIIEDALGNQLVIIPLFNDGASSHGDDAGLLNGSPTGATDTIYSNLWIAPFKLQTGVPYYLHIEAADNFAKDSSDITHVYKTDLYNVLGNELEFYLTDACLATCGTIGEYRCSKGVREECVFDAVNSCNAWKASSSCASGVCCGANSMIESAIGCCPVGSNFCDTSTYTCLTCDNTCNNSCSNTACPKSLDPDCGGGGCCGDGSCDAGVGETPGTCNADCPDTGVPTITITNPANGSSKSDSAIFFIEATIIDDYNSIATNPNAVISIGATNYRTVPLLSIGANKFRSAVSIDAYDIPVLNSATYTLTVTASDTSILGNTASNSINFNIICSNECSLSAYPTCSGDDKVGCVMGGDGCYDIVTETSCPTLFGGDGVCRNNNCCEENCSLSDPKSCADATHLNSCVLQSNGCNLNVSGIDCKVLLSNPAAECRTGTGGSDCCVDTCTPGPAVCNGTGTAIQNCVLNTTTGCYAPSFTNCVGSQVCKDTGSGGATCCTNGCSPLGGTDLVCDSSNIWTRDCGTNTTTGCTEFTNADNCSIIPPISGLGFKCAINSAFKANCCENECTGSTVPSCSGNNLLSCSSSASADGCLDNLVTDCSITGDSCRTGSIGANCCQDECVLGAPLSCNIGDSATLECQVDSFNGCNHLVTKDNCTASGKVCIDGSPAFCGDLDLDPPVVTLNYPVTYNTAWIQDTQVDFETPGFTTFQTNTTNNPGSVGLSFEPAAPITSTDGNITISTVRNINTDTISSLRSCADGISYNVILLGVSSATLSSAPAVGCLVPGDIVMLTNLQGTLANNSNTGNYEFLTVQSVSGAIVLFASPKTKFYGNGLSDDTNIGTAVTNQRVILQRVPRYNNVTITSTGSLTANDWDGSKGGVLTFFASGTVTIDGVINMNEKGYRGVSIDGHQGESFGGNGGLSCLANFGGGGGKAESVTPGCDWGSGGGSYGTPGGSEMCSPGITYGDTQLSKLFFGSAGGFENTCGKAGDGGGIIYINALNINVGGSINSRGETMILGDCGGAGAGGSIYLKGENINIGTEKVVARGGTGYPDGDDGDICYWADGPQGGNGRTHIKTNNAIVGSALWPVPVVSTLSSYYLSGTYTSAVYDTVNNNGYGIINWNATLPVGTSMSVRVRSCTDASCTSGDNWGLCENLNNGDDLSTASFCVSGNERYIQYQVGLGTSNPAVTPTLDRIEINYNQSVNLLTGSSMVFIATIIDTSALSTINPPRVQIQNLLGVNIGAPLIMYDDGAHGDGPAGNGVYGTNAWNSTGQPLGGYFIDLSARDIFENLNINFNNIGHFVII